MSDWWSEEARWRFPWRKRPLNPAFFRDRLHAAFQALGTLNGILSMLSEPMPFAQMMARREAVASWNLEKREILLSADDRVAKRLLVTDLLAYEMHECSAGDESDLHRVSRIASILGRDPADCVIDLRPTGIQRLQGQLWEGDGPAAWRSAERWMPGKRRDRGHARHVYSGPERIRVEMEAWSDFVIHDHAVDVPVKDALAHTQLELIRPFENGNGIIARMLLQLILLREKCVSQPVLCLSEHLYEEFDQRVLRLQKVAPLAETAASKRLWEKNSVDRILCAIVAAANDGCSVIPKIARMFAEHEAQVRGLGRAADSVLKAYTLFKHQGVVTARYVQRELGVSFPTANSAITRLERLGFVRRLSYPGRSRLFAYWPYLQHLKALPEDPPL